jgi:hypothetical protein
VCVCVCVCVCAWCDFQPKIIKKTSEFYKEEWSTANIIYIYIFFFFLLPNVKNKWLQSLARVCLPDIGFSMSSSSVQNLLRCLFSFEACV